ncbi:MAG: hypothetical protein ACOYJU_04440 [Anaerovoracaceae bacterium]
MFTGLDVKKVSGESQEIRQVKKLYYSSFPREERTPFNILLHDTEKDDCELLSFFDRDIFVGMNYVIEHKGLILLLYLAVEEVFRNQGYGGEILRNTFDRYSNATVVLDIESVWADVEDIGKRLERREFYIRNGFVSANLGFSLEGVDYEVLARGELPTPKTCGELYKKTSFQIDVFYPLCPSSAQK